MDKKEETKTGDELNIAINDYIDTNTEDMNLIIVDDPVKSERLDNKFLKPKSDLDKDQNSQIPTIAEQSKRNSK